MSSGKTRYTVHGPFEVDRESLLKGTANLAAWWAQSKEVSSLGTSKGVYVFGIRAGQGITPWYVGMTKSQDFAHEVFNLSNRLKYMAAVSEYAKGGPVVFLISRPKKKGAVGGEIEAIEDVIIARAFKRNPNLLNVKKLPEEASWAIAGVINDGSGKPSHAAEAFKQVIGLD